MWHRINECGIICCQSNPILDRKIWTLLMKMMTKLGGLLLGFSGILLSLVKGRRSSNFTTTNIFK